MKKRAVKTQKVPKNVTLDDLARMMAEGFIEVGQQFDELDERLFGKINTLDHKITAVNANVLGKCECPLVTL